MNLAVFGETEDEARERFKVAAQKAAELRARPDPGSLRNGDDFADKSFQLVYTDP